MTTLHTLNKLPSEQLLRQIKAAAQSGDALLLIEDGTYLSMSASCEEISPLFETGFMIQTDASARGIADNDNFFQSISYDKFVELSCQHSRVLSWY